MRLLQRTRTAQVYTRFKRRESFDSLTDYLTTL